MKKSITIPVICVSLFLAACSSGISTDEYNNAVAEVSKAQESLDAAEAANESLSTEMESVKAVLEERESVLADLTAEYATYKATMAPYEKLESAEAEARLIEAESIAESKTQAEAESKAAEQSQREAEEKLGYDTGITYDQLARTPDDFIEKKVKFKGTVIQTIEGDEAFNQLRLATKNGYDDVIMCEYEKDLVSSRILVNDTITVYGISYGLISYESTGSGIITIPYMVIEQVDQ